MYLLEYDLSFKMYVSELKDVITENNWHPTQFNHITEIADNTY